MRRNITYQKSVNYFSIIFLFVYLPLCSIFYIFPPFLAISFLLFSFHKQDKWYMGFMIAFLFLFDVSFGFFPFSTIIYFILLQAFVVNSIQRITTCHKCTVALKVLVVYFGYLIFSFLLSTLINIEFLDINYLYFTYYALVEIIIAIFIDED